MTQQEELIVISQGGAPSCRHPIVSKGWGYESWIVNQEYCGKELFFFSGKKCSFHFHKIKAETFLVASGAFEVKHYMPHEGAGWWELPAWQFQKRIEHTYYLSATTLLNPGDIFHVPRGLIHQMMAVGGDSKLIEFSSHHDDSDSYRVIRGD